LNVSFSWFMITLSTRLRNTELREVLVKKTLWMKQLLIS